MKGLYVHIPFCKSICSYCDFPKEIAKNEKQILYVEHLLEEIEDKKEQLIKIDTVYFGGGTPNAIELQLLRKLFTRLSDILKNAKETTIELNPEYVTEELVFLLKEFHVNRVSLGVQSIHPNSIALLNRHHSKQQVKNAVELLRRYGIHNINMDFIFGISNTTLKNVEEDIEFILKLNVPHISYYSLILEDKSILKYQIDKGLYTLPDEDLVADMYDFIVRKLQNSGYHHYEISNFAKYGYESKHNQLYWNCEEYIGIGSSACGYIKPYRYQNPVLPQAYLSKKEVEKEYISTEDEKKEFFLLGLRQVDGVSIKKYQERFQKMPQEDFSFDLLIQKGLIEITGDSIRIKKDKLFVANLVFEEFVGD